MAGPHITGFALVALVIIATSVLAILAASIVVDRVDELRHARLGRFGLQLGHGGILDLIGVALEPSGVE